MKQRWLALSNEIKGVLMGMASALLVTAYLVTNKHIYNTFHPSAVEYSLLFAVMGAVFALGSLMHRYDRQRYQRVWRDKWSFATLAAASFCAVGLLVIGQRYTSSINASFIGTSSIVTTMLFSAVLLHESPSRRQLWWLAVLLVGLYLGVVGLHRLEITRGDAIVFVAAFFFGFGNVWSRRVMQRHGSFVVPNIRLVVAGIFALALSPLLVQHWQLLWSLLPWAVLAGLFYWLTMKTFATSVHLINANHAIVLNNGQIVTTSLAGVLLLGEHYTWEKLVGSVVVLVSIYAITRKNGRRKSLKSS
jgi:drug/metabolite transporter (DMT)-like permease